MNRLILEACLPTGMLWGCCRQVVGLTDGEDLLGVVHAMNELESAPLVDAERAEDHVAGASVGRAEDIFGFG